MTAAGMSEVCTTCRFYREEFWSGARLNFWDNLSEAPGRTQSKRWDEDKQYSMNRGKCHRYPTPVEAPGHCGEWQSSTT